MLRGDGRRSGAPRSPSASSWSSAPVAVDGRSSVPPQCPASPTTPERPRRRRAHPHADLAMYRAKQKGKGRYECFEPNMADAMLQPPRAQGRAPSAIERERDHPRVPADRGVARGRRRPPKRWCVGRTRARGLRGRPSSCRGGGDRPHLALGQHVWRRRAAGARAGGRRPRRAAAGAREPLRRRAAGPDSWRRGGGARRVRPRPEAAGARGHRDALLERRGGEPDRAAALRRPACASRSTTSAPATRRSATCGRSRSTSSRSPSRSSTDIAAEGARKLVRRA